MMQDLAMHLLELLMNSIEHGGKNIILKIFDSLKENRIYFELTDDGDGMDEEFVEAVTSPFSTSRSTRKIGMGLAFLKALVDGCNGHLSIKSKLKEGTSIYFDVQKDHIDLPPFGDIGEDIYMCFNKNPNINVFFEYKTDFDCFTFDLNEIILEIGQLDLSDSSIQLWIKDYINERMGLI